MPPSEIRKEARETLKGKWGKAVCIYLIFYILTFIIEKLFDNQGANFFGIKYWISYIISVPLSFGLIISFMKIKRNEEVKIWDFIKDGFLRFGKSWGITWYTFIRLLLPIACFVLITILHFVLMFANANVQLSTMFSLAYVVLLIATIIYVACRGLLYVIAYNISYDNPELSSKECVNKSEALMKGHRGNYILLQLSFIGWAILLAFGFSLGTSFLVTLFGYFGFLLGYALMIVGMSFLMPYMQVAVVCFYERVLNDKKAEKIEE